MLDQKPPDIRDLGEHELKGLSDKLHLYVITAKALCGRLE